VLNAVGYVNATTFTPFVSELATVPGLPAVLAAVLLRGALRNDPGFFPGVDACPDGSCNGPDVLTLRSAELVNPIPVWRLVQPQSEAAALDQLYAEYKNIVTTVLEPHLVAAGVTTRRLEWVATKIAQANAAAETEATGIEQSSRTDDGDGGGSVSNGGDMVAELMKLRIKALRTMLKDKYAGECEECKTKEQFAEKIARLELFEKKKRANQLRAQNADGAGVNEHAMDVPFTIHALVAELVTRERFDKGLIAVLHQRDTKMAEDFCTELGWFCCNRQFVLGAHVSTENHSRRCH
jgi:hypothetical protein